MNRCQIVLGPPRKKHIDNEPQYEWLNAGKRLRLLHGPIDLILEAHGEPAAVAQAYQQAHKCFADILLTLVSELAHLRDQITPESEMPRGCVAQRMFQAAAPYAAESQLSAMIAVAGSVADHVLHAMCGIRGLGRLSVNNGGDIALWLAPGESLRIGICEDIASGQIGSRITLQDWHGVGGVATSGWRGRSHSLGIADAVTVLANCAADADVAATLIANAVDIPGCHSIQRQAAIELSPDSDLGERLVTVGVDTLSPQLVSLALNRGHERALQLMANGRITAAFIHLQGTSIVCDHTINILDAGVMHA